MTASRIPLLVLIVGSTCLSANTTPTLLSGKLQALAGASSRECGSIPLDVEPNVAIVCAKKALLSHTAFRIAIEHQGIDSTVWEGAAGNGHGQLWVLNYDSYDASPTVNVSPCREVLFVPFPPADQKPIHTRDEIKCKTACGEP
jgi:hypothetical protein